MLGIREAAESIGFRTQGVRISFEQLAQDTPHIMQSYHAIISLKIIS